VSTDGTDGIILRLSVSPAQTPEGCVHGASAHGLLHVQPIENHHACRLRLETGTKLKDTIWFWQQGRNSKMLGPPYASRLLIMQAGLRYLHTCWCQLLSFQVVFILTSGY
jgi:hypothetical protein